MIYLDANNFVFLCLSRWTIIDLKSYPHLLSSLPSRWYCLLCFVKIHPPGGVADYPPEIFFGHESYYLHCLVLMDDGLKMPTQHFSKLVLVLKQSKTLAITADIFSDFRWHSLWLIKYTAMSFLSLLWLPWYFPTFSNFRRQTHIGFLKRAQNSEIGL